MKTYKANRKGFINYLLIIFVVLPITIFLLDKDILLARPIILLPLLSPLILLCWIYFDTLYTVENNELIYRSGFLRGSINISTIREIIRGQTMWSGIKPALAQKGLIIRFNRFDEIYIAPESNDEVISDLLKVNPNIDVIEKK